MISKECLQTRTGSCMGCAIKEMATVVQRQKLNGRILSAWS